jgi:hypothetical protein
MLVIEVERKLIEGDARFFQIKKEFVELSKKSKGSRKRTLTEKMIPQDPDIIAYLEAPKEIKADIAKTLTPEQLNIAGYAKEYLGKVLDYLIKRQSLTKGRENYFTHMRKSFLENVKDDSVLSAAKKIFKAYEEDQVGFNILDEKTGKIMPFEKWFPYTMRRTGALDPSMNFERVFLSYAKTAERMMSLDELLPKMNIYAQAMTPEKLTPRGLEFDQSIKEFIFKYINNKKGRRIRWMSQQNGKIDMAISATRTVTTMLDLGLNIPVGVASSLGEQATTLQGLGLEKYNLGTKRLTTEQGKRIVEENKAFVGENFWDVLLEPWKEITDRFQEVMFGAFRVASVTANKQFLLGSLTPNEFKTGVISSKRLAELKVEMGRWRKVVGAESLVGSTQGGKGLTQYKSWAVPIIRTTIKDIETVLKKTGTPEDIARAKSDLIRIAGISATVAVVGAVVVGATDDRSFVGQLRAKAYRELNTLMQGLSPALWLSTPRVITFYHELGKHLQEIATLEEYKTESESRWSDLKGVEGLKRQMTPRAVKQVFSGNSEESEGRKSIRGERKSLGGERKSLRDH